MRVQKINIGSKNTTKKNALTIELDSEEVNYIDAALSDYARKSFEEGFIRKFSYDWTVLTNFLNNGVIKTEE